MTGITYAILKMPCTIVTINTDFTKEQGDAFCLDICQVVAKETGKPLNYCMAGVRKADMAFGTSTDLCCFVDFYCVGVISQSKNPAISAAITACLTQHFKVKPERVYISFNESKGHNWGFNGSTF